MVQRVDGFLLVTSARKHAANRVGGPPHVPVPPRPKRPRRELAMKRGALGGQYLATQNDAICFNRPIRLGQCAMCAVIGQGRYGSAVCHQPN